MGICDKNLIGEAFNEGNKKLEVKAGFYKDREINTGEAIELVQRHSNVMITGPEIIKVLKEKGLIAEYSTVQGVPYAMIFKW